MSAMRIPLLLILSGLALHAVAREKELKPYCLPATGARGDEATLNSTLAAAGATSESELKEKMAHCCPQHLGECRAAGGICLPSYANAFCRLSVDCLCPSGSCTCCFFQLPCKGICSFNGGIGFCRSRCRPNERPIPGKCGCGGSSCSCCSSALRSESEDLEPYLG
ncbi:uncharacterized protein LOC122255161 isoform X2 [Penaeus japonicus]|uniref:uncharacterized protein LOC122255161 isoform X2 n=1 Tax=Penaeus japonicus TaxID=27405 RepID=UPI001C70C11F|nr:uncharacterized protein LOC122255161 isoform X2 [Penaeus japonicus]XP_042875011.1 uncharacterized protein LOC122255161 isoform X2 [Penaeus japonicus]